MKYFYFLIILFFLSSININAQEDVITDLDRPVGLVFNGNDLYFTEANIGKISKIDITEATPTAAAVASGLSSPYTLALNGNDLYIAEYTANKISKIDITAGGTSTDVVTGLFGPEGLALNGNELYIAEIPANKISKIAIGATAGIDDQNQLDISIYPNPTSDMVYIGGNYTQLKVVIYNILGKEVINKSITNSIDISHLENGVYLMKLSDGVKLYTRKVIKN